VILTEPDQDDFTVDVHTRERCGAHLGQRLNRIAADFCDARYRITRGKYTAESRREEKVASLNVSISRQEGERERDRVTRAHGDGP
jgi:hypothetical protein